MQSQAFTVHLKFLFKSISRWLFYILYSNEIGNVFVFVVFWFYLRIAYSVPLRLKFSPALLAGMILARIMSWFPMRFCRLYLTFSFPATAKDDDLSTTELLLVVFLDNKESKMFGGRGRGGWKRNGGPYLSRSEAANPLSYIAIILCV